MGLKQLILTVIFINFLLVGCDKERSTFYDNGNLKSTYFLNKNNKKEGFERTYYETGEIRSITQYKNGIWIDSIINYKRDKTILFTLKKYNDSLFLKNFNNNIIISQGKVDKELKRIDWWSFYKNRKLDSRLEYIKVNKQYVINQKKYYTNNKLDTLKSIYYNFVKPYKLKSQQQYDFKIEFNFNHFEKNLLDKEYYYLLISPKINEDFSNIDKVVLDTIVPFNKNEFVYNLKFKNKGVKNFRAVIEKHILIERQNKMYIDISRIFINEKLNIE